MDIIKKVQAQAQNREKTRPVCLPQTLTALI